VVVVTLAAVVLASFVIGGTVCWALLWALLRGTGTAGSKKQSAGAGGARIGADHLVGKLTSPENRRKAKTIHR
jgi:hypothetical protein